MSVRKNIPFFLLLIFLSVITIESCAPKAACGSKRDHRVRKKKTKRMAPGMMLGNNSCQLLAISC